MSLLTNLIRYYKLDGNSVDVVGGNDGTDTNITYNSGNGKIIQGAGFNGTDSKIGNNAVSVNLGTDATISCWMKSTNTPSGANPQVYGYRFPGNSPGYPLFLFAHENGTGKVNLDLLDSNGITSQTNSGSALNDGNWHFLVGIKLGNTAKLYVDGNLIGSDTQSFTGNFNGMNLGIGHYYDDGGSNNEYYNGAVDECGYWSRALSGAEITQLYNSGAGLAYPFGVTSNGNFLGFM